MRYQRATTERGAEIAAKLDAFADSTRPEAVAGDERRTPALTCTFAVETMGLEPTTPCLQSRCSSQLSYVPVVLQHATRPRASRRR